MASQVEDAAVRAQGECGPSGAAGAAGAAADGGGHVPFQEFCEPAIDEDEAEDADHGVEEAAAETPVATSPSPSRSPTSPASPRDDMDADLLLRAASGRSRGSGVLCNADVPQEE